MIVTSIAQRRNIGLLGGDAINITLKQFFESQLACFVGDYRLVEPYIAKLGKKANGFNAISHLPSACIPFLLKSSYCKYLILLEYAWVALPIFPRCPRVFGKQFQNPLLTCQS